MNAYCIFIRQKLWTQSTIHKLQDRMPTTIYFIVISAIPFCNKHIILNASVEHKIKTYMCYVSFFIVISQVDKTWHMIEIYHYRSVSKWTPR